MDILPLVIEGLEMTLRAVKGKYLKFKTHFRFRTLHILLMECLAWLPPGSFMSSMQGVFVEGLRVLKDSIAAGYECTSLLRSTKPQLADNDTNISDLPDTLSRILPENDFCNLNINGMSSSKSMGFIHNIGSAIDLPLNEHCLMLRLEVNAHVDILYIYICFFAYT